MLLRPLALAAALTGLISTVAGEKMIESMSLNTCQDNSSFTASLFNVVFTPSNGSVTFDVVAVSSINGNVTFDADITVYGYNLEREQIDPCEQGLAGLCPMVAGKIATTFNLAVPDSVVKNIPSIAYGVPDLDAQVKVFINLTSDPTESVACVEAMLSNGQTVDQKGVSWATAVVAGLALLASAVTSGLGQTNTAAHVASNALSLFSYFQAQAMVGLTALHMPPIVQSWTQNFQWTMGIIEIDFMQEIFTWYQKSTGGTPATLFDTLTTQSVQVVKRSLEYAPAATRQLMSRAASLLPRDLVARDTTSTTTGNYVVKGIDRVAYRSSIESTNLFMTGLTFFCIFVILVVIGVAAFKGGCELAVKNKWMDNDKFLEFRNGWTTVLKGILYRVTLIGFPQMTVLCLWEFTQVDSPAEVVLAIFFFFGMCGTLGWGAFKVIRIARRSITMHQNPAYILYSDPSTLNKWGFLYVQFRATAYYFIVPLLVYTVIKSMFIGLAQSSGTAQAIGLLIVEAGALIGASVLRPWMDKSTNSFNIAICSINFLNTIFLLIFSDVFDQPGLVTGVVGVVFFVVNAVFALVLLILVLIATGIAFFRKNPDLRYQFMADDRASFIKSQTQLTTELDALGATARGEGKGPFKGGLDLDDDNESISSESMRRRMDAANMPLPPSGTNSARGSYREPPRSPVDPSVPLFPANGRSGTPQQYPESPRLPYSDNHQMMRSASPNPYQNAPAFRQQNNASPMGFRSQNNASSPWQRGAGYEH